MSLTGRAWDAICLRALQILLFLQVIFWSTVSILLFLFDSSGRLTHLYGARPWASMMLWTSRVTVSLEGAENLVIHDDTPRVLVANHQSLYDILAVLKALPIDFKFVVKRALRRVPLWGYAMDKAGYLFIDAEQSGDVRALIKEAVHRMTRGSSMLFFAEGTRSADGRLGQFKRGAFLLASRSGCNVVPVVIQGSREVVPKGSFHIRPGHITVTVLEPITDTALLKNSRRLTEEVRRMMAKQLGQEAET
jgi:1-acyl-sn-glycerol-3-phosphate acyltransferase